LQSRNVVSPSSLSDLKEIGCKSVWLVYISPLFRPIEQLLAFKIVKIYPHPVTFSLRFFKSDRLLEAFSDILGSRLSDIHAASEKNKFPWKFANTRHQTILELLYS
jgi:hypothetical protein